MNTLCLFNTFATARGDGLHPKLRLLLERTAASPQAELTVRRDGMIQADSDPVSDAEPRQPGNIRPCPIPALTRRSFDCEARTGVLQPGDEPTSLRRSSGNVDDPNEVKSGQEQ